MHVILANGAPFSGKDTLVKNLLERYPTAVWVRFKDCLYTDSHKRLFPNDEITLVEWIAICNNIHLKDKPLPFKLTKENIMRWSFNILVLGMKADSLNMCYKPVSNNNEEIVFVELCDSPRNELIYQSESIIKVAHGEGGVAVRTAQSLMENNFNYENKLFIFSDGGFNVEVETLMKVLEIERSDMTVIRIEADGCTFEGDSREYILNPDYTIFNDKTDNFFKTVEEAGIYDKFDNIQLSHKPFDFPEVYCYISDEAEHVNFIKKIEYSIDGEVQVLTGDKFIHKWIKKLDWNKPPEQYDYFKIYTFDTILKYVWSVEGYLWETIVTK